jgi:hypothetical protein
MVSIHEYIRQNRVAALRIPLKDELPLYQVVPVLNAISNTYQSSVWLSAVSRASPGAKIDPFREPDPGEDLRLVRAEIGTPNFLLLVGELVHWAPVIGLVVSALAIPKIFVDVRKTWHEGTKTKYDAALSKSRFEIESTSLPDGVGPRARELFKTGKLDDVTIKDKEEWDNAGRAMLQANYRRVAEVPSLIVIDEAAQDSP